MGSKAPIPIPFHDNHAQLSIRESRISPITAAEVCPWSSERWERTSANGSIKQEISTY
jgi:hypothetical protein